MSVRYFVECKLIKLPTYRSRVEIVIIIVEID